MSNKNFTESQHDRIDDMIESLQKLKESGSEAVAVHLNVAHEGGVHVLGVTSEPMSAKHPLSIYNMALSMKGSASELQTQAIEEAWNAVVANTKDGSELENRDEILSTLYRSSVEPVTDELQNLTKKAERALDKQNERSDSLLGMLLDGIEEAVEA